MGLANPEFMVGDVCAACGAAVGTVPRCRGQDAWGCFRLHLVVSGEAAA